MMPSAGWPSYLHNIKFSNTRSPGQQTWKVNYNTSSKIGEVPSKQSQEEPSMGTKEAEHNIEKRWSLQGSTALVTGGTKGIGHAIVQELATLGSTVHTCSRNEAELNKCLQGWRDLNFSVTGSVCDVSSRADRAKLMERVSSMFQGKLSILINNAGTGTFKPTIDCTADDYAFLMATNFESAFDLSRLAYPLLKASGAGAIVHISSVAGLVGVPGLTLYGATKGAVNQLTRNLACEWANDNIRTNCIAPGHIRTRLTQPRLDSNPEAAAKEISRIPLGASDALVSQRKWHL